MPASFSRLLLSIYLPCLPCLLFLCLTSQSQPSSKPLRFAWHFPLQHKEALLHCIYRKCTGPWTFLALFVPHRSLPLFLHLRLHLDRTVPCLPSCVTINLPPFHWQLPQSPSTFLCPFLFTTTSRTNQPCQPTSKQQPRTLSGTFRLLIDRPTNNNEFSPRFLLLADSIFFSLLTNKQANRPRTAPAHLDQPSLTNFLQPDRVHLLQIAQYAFVRW